MARPFSDFSNQFFWDFKRMDNVNYNFEIITELYILKKTSTNPKLLNKSIIILIGSIIECCLYDFLVRIKQFKSDLVPAITPAQVAFIKAAKETDLLKEIIIRVENQNLLLVNTGDTLYSDLEHLRKVRNRVHIQNKFASPPRSEQHAFSSDELNRAQICLERVVDVLCNSYQRNQLRPIPMTDFPRPWL